MSHHRATPRFTTRRIWVSALLVVAAGLASLAACADPAGPGPRVSATPTAPNLDLIATKTTCPQPFDPSGITDPDAAAADHNGNGQVCQMTIAQAQPGEVIEVRTVAFVDDNVPVRVGNCHVKFEMVEAPKDAATGAWDAVDLNQNLKKCKAKKIKKEDGREVEEIVYSDDTLD